MKNKFEREKNYCKDINTVIFGVFYRKKYLPVYIVTAASKGLAFIYAS